MMKKYKLLVKEVVQEAPDTITIVFQQPENETITYQAGQFLTLEFHINNKSVRRAYSLCSSPATDQHLAVTVKRVEGGLISNFLNDNLKTGDFVDVLSPVGNFTPEITPATQTHLVLFAGGSGITPLMSMLKTALHTAPQSKVTLVYTSRYAEAIIFKDALDALEAQYSDRLKVYHVITSPSPQWNGYKGRLDFDKISEIYNQLPKDTTKSHWLCGPEGMMDVIEKSLHVLGVNELRKESFNAHIDEASKKAAEQMAGDKEREVVVIYSGDTYKFKVKPGQTILDAAMEKDVDLPYSCQSGLCTACMGKCTSGKVQLEEEDSLTDQEISEGYVLTCVGHPLTDDVVIEID